MKIKRFQKLLRNKKISLAILLNWGKFDQNIEYFTGLKLEYCFLLIPKKGNSMLYTSMLEYENAKKFSKVKNVKIFEKPALSAIPKFANKRKILGINKTFISLNEFKELKKYLKKKKFIDISKLLLTQRKRKFKDEIKRLRKAAKIGDEIFKKIITNFKFKTELEVEKFILNEIHSAGCVPSFSPIVASGKNASMPHYKARDVSIRKGFLLMDFGVEYQGYKSDMSRTIYLGKPSLKETEIYNIVLSTQKRAIANAKIGVHASSLMKQAKKDLGTYQKYFFFALGHGIGIQIHELPNISERSKEVLEEGNVFTIEPGVHIENKLGIRIEDDILIKKNKTEILTKSPKELISI